MDSKKRYVLRCFSLLHNFPGTEYVVRLKFYFKLFRAHCVLIHEMHKAVDFVPLYPVELPSWVTSIYRYFRINYNDPLYEKDPPFFRLYVIIEAVFSVPTCVLAIRGLIQGTSLHAQHSLQ